MSTRRSWTRNEIILAINLYCKIPFGRIHNRNPDIIELARIIGRTPSAVSWKLANFAHLDPSLPRKGASNVSRLDGEIWEEFFNNWDDLAYESEQLLKSFGRKEPMLELEEEIIHIPDGREKEKLIKSRVNQWFFRKAVLVSYDFSCCITGISDDRLLIASHIIPWSKDIKNRTNPRNGLCLNSLHDKAFDSGLITIDKDSRVVLSSSLKKSNKSWINDHFLRYEGTPIRQPKRFLPEKIFFEYHRENIFVG